MARTVVSRAIFDGGGLVTACYACEIRDRREPL